MTSGPTELGPIEALTAVIAEIEAQVARLRAEQASVIAELDRRIPATFPEAAREELVVACRITQTQARGRLETARALARRLTHTRAALAAGRISFEHAIEMAEATGRLTAQEAALVETEVLDDPRAITPGQLGWRAREAASRLVPLPHWLPTRHGRRSPSTPTGIPTEPSTTACTCPPPTQRWSRPGSARRPAGPAPRTCGVPPNAARTHWST